MSERMEGFNVVQGKRPDHYEEHGGCTIRHGLGGTEVLKYKKKRGYWHKDGKIPVSVETAKLAGYDVEADRRAWDRQEFMQQAKAAADQAYAAQMRQIEAKHPELSEELVRKAAIEAQRQDVDPERVVAGLPQVAKE